MIKMDKQQGARLAGYNANKNREENDYYATPKDTLIALLERESFIGTFLEPCCGEGNISKVLKEAYNFVTSNDLINRGYGDTFKDFLSDDFERYDNIITNPPFKYAQQFVEKSLSITNNKVAMLLKIQFLEGIARRKMFDQFPPKKIYVFSKRQTCLKNGLEYNENGKKWASTVCYAWFVWEHGYTGKPTIEWI